jgi:ferredoxin-NADP reductase
MRHLSKSDDTRLTIFEPQRGLAADANGSLRLCVTRVLPESKGVISVKLVRDDGASLPPWDPGSHIDVHLPSGRVRQYSLCGDPEKLVSYKFAVLREAAGRGGSAELHSIARTGVRLDVGRPRNRFPLRDGKRFLFLAGGIGVTPLMSMVQAAERRGRRWTFIYGGRTRSSMAFTAELARRRGGNFCVVPQDEQGYLNFDPLLHGVPADTLIYACGPSAMLAAIEAAAAHHRVSRRLHVERFSAPQDTKGLPQPSPDQAFDVILNRSQRTVHVPAGRTLGSVLQEEGADVSFSCEEGSCGTCETRVLSGLPEHRDCCLSDEEKTTNDRMIVCVGRALTATLVLDA